MKSSLQLAKHQFLSSLWIQPPRIGTSWANIRSYCMGRFDSIPQPPAFEAVSFTVLALLGALINTILLVCLIRNPLGCFRNSSSYLVANQAFSDLTTCLTYALYSIATVSYPSLTAGSVIGKVYSILLVTSCTGFVALFLVSLDRFLAVRYPIRYRICAKSSIVFSIIFIVWSSTLVLILVTLLLDIVSKVTRYILLTIGTLLVGLNISLHCCAFYTIKKKYAEIQSRSEPRGQNSQLAALRREKRFLFTVFIITVVVLVTIVPFLLYLELMGLAWSYSKTATVVVMIFYWIGPIARPYIYFIRLNNYYRSLKMIFCNHCSSWTAKINHAITYCC